MHSVENDTLEQTISNIRVKDEWENVWVNTINISHGTNRSPVSVIQITVKTEHIDNLNLMEV